MEIARHPAMPHPSSPKFGTRFENPSEVGNPHRSCPRCTTNLAPVRRPSPKQSWGPTNEHSDSRFGAAESLFGGQHRSSAHSRRCRDGEGRRTRNSSACQICRTLLVPCLHHRQVAILIIPDDPVVVFDCNRFFENLPHASNLVLHVESKAFPENRKANRSSLFHLILGVLT